MGFKLKGVSGFHNSGTPILKKDLDNNILAEANKDGTIYLDKSIDENSDKGKESIAHEKVHIDQMKRGDLDYDDGFVYWKNKKYSRSKMKEGAENLPWEDEAYSSTRKKRRNGKRKR